MKTKKTAKFWTVLALIICLVSALGASLVQSAFGKVTVKDMRWETSSGKLMSALLFVPDTATPQNPAPAIVVSHGWYNTREMQDLNFVEYARRGYVVISIDMYGHGNSEVLKNATWWNPENNANGMYDAVKLLSTLPYVDSGKIGITGHSNGALASRVAMLLDNEAPTQLISAALLVSNDSIYTDEEENFANPFGSRDVGIVACQYDEFFHRTKKEDGSKSAPRDFIDQSTAQSFLQFGRDPAGLQRRESYTVYHEQVQGEDAMRVVYNPNQIHPWAHFSKNVVASSVEFFGEALSAPNPLAPQNQVWQWKVLFNAVGLVGFMMFLVGFSLLLLETKAFAELKALAPVKIGPAPTGKGKLWFWGALAAGTVFSMITYMGIYSWCSKYRPGFLPQAAVFYIGTWAALCGLFTLLTLWLSYRFFGKRDGVDLKERGVLIGWKKLGKSALMALTAACAAYALVFITDYFFKVDFRLWCLTLKAFTPDKFGIILSFLPLFLLYYVINSISVNSFNFVRVGRSEWMNTALMAIFNALSPAVLIIWIYTTFTITGFHPMETLGIGGSIVGIWLFPIVVVLPVAAVVSRILYKATRNPYIAGIAMAVIVTAMSCTNTLTQWT